MVNLTERQGRMIARGLTVLSFTLVFAFVVFVLWVVYRMLALTSSALVPVMLGFFLALFFKPYYLWWKRLVRNPTVALLVMLTTVFVPVGVILWHAGAIFLDQLTNLVSQGPTLVNQVSIWFRATFPRVYGLLGQFGVPPADFGELYARYGATALKAGSGAIHCLTGVISAIVTLCFFVFFLMSGGERRSDEFVGQLAFLKESTRGFVSEQLNVFIDILVSFFQRQVVICLIEGVMYGTGFWLVGLPYGFLIGFALGILNLIPLFGSVVCLPVALPLAYFVHGGSLMRLVLVLAVWLCGQVLDGYLITPRIQGDKTGLGYAGVIFSFIFWASVLGPMLGMLLAIPLSAFCVVLWRALKSQYIKPFV